MASALTGLAWLGSDWPGVGTPALSEWVMPIFVICGIIFALLYLRHAAKTFSFREWLRVNCGRSFRACTPQCQNRLLHLPWLVEAIFALPRAAFRHAGVAGNVLSRSPRV